MKNDFQAYSAKFDLKSEIEVQSEIQNLETASAQGDGYASFLLHFWYAPDLILEDQKIRKQMILGEDVSFNYVKLALQQLKNNDLSVRNLRALALLCHMTEDCSEAIKYWEMALDLGDYDSGRELIAFYSNGQYKNKKKLSAVRKKGRILFEKHKM